MFRPQDNNGFGGGERPFDFIRKLGAAFDVAVPPDAMTGFLERGRKLARRVEILAIIAKKNLSHAGGVSTIAETPSLNSSTRLLFIGAPGNEAAARCHACQSATDAAISNVSFGSEADTCLSYESRFSCQGERPVTTKP